MHASQKTPMQQLLWVKVLKMLKALLLRALPERVVNNDGATLCVVKLSMGG